MNIFFRLNILIHSFCQKHQPNLICPRNFSAYHVDFMCVSCMLIVLLRPSNKINQPDASVSHIYCSSFKSSSTCFGHSHAHHQELINCSSRLRLAVETWWWQCCWSWSGRPARPRTQHDCHHDTKVKPEAATAVIGLLMMGRKTPETC
jgi:hypothetical protein